MLLGSSSLMFFGLSFPKYKPTTTSIVQLQTDIGALSQHGFEAFTSVLAALPADNVSLLALSEMKDPGTVFLASGDFADSDATDLQRCSYV